MGLRGIMGSRYIITWFDYPFNGYDGEYQTNNIIKFLFVLIKCIYKYDGVNVEVRW